MITYQLITSLTIDIVKLSTGTSLLVHDTYVFMPIPKQINFQMG